MVPISSRNAPCSCGSGKRYKNCHGALGGRGASAPAQPAPERAELVRERARLEWTRGDARAEATCLAALELAPGDVAAWNLLGEIRRATDPAAAEEAWRQALRLEPGNAEASFRLGNLERGRGEPKAAIAHYERALRSVPGHPGVLNNLGLALEALGERGRAEACYRDVLGADPQQPDALGNLASVLFERENFADSVATYERFFSIRREVPAAVWTRRAIAQQRIGDLAAAEVSFREAARRLPDDLSIQINLAMVCVDLHRYAEAEPALLRALELDASNPYALSMLAHARQHRCAWAGLSEIFARLNHLLEAEPVEGSANADPFAVLAMPTSPQAQLHAAQRWARGLAPLAPPRPVVTLAPGERLRVGFVSSDFREHPVARQTVELWERIERGRIETFAYSTLPKDSGPFGQRIANAFEHFADVSAQPTATLVERIRADRIAILVDLNGYTTHARSEIFALRPAPLQVNWLGYIGTLGAAWFDYVITDRFTTPEDQQPFFSERFLYLPDYPYPSDSRREVAPHATTRAENGLPPDGFVFCCFNHQYKILPSVFDVWMRLLVQVPGSVLWLSPANAEATANLRREAAARGVDPERLVFAPRIPLPRHLARHAHADLFLDTAPYNAHTTSNDALFMGLPVLTCAGSTMASRVAGSQLHVLGLPELVTTSSRDYEALALRLAQHPDELGALRARIAANRDTHPLFDMERFAHNLGAALVQMWRDHTARISSI